MNNEQQELLDEAYKNYCTQLVKDSFLLSRNRLPLDVFINKCKTNPEFSERWGLKIEERELSLEERQDLYFKLNPEFRLMHESMIEHMIKHNIPTKLITITKITKIESYE